MTDPENNTSLGEVQVKRPGPRRRATPVILVWREGGQRRERRFQDLRQGRAAAVRIIDMDDRITAGLFNAYTKELIGKVVLIAGMPAWAVTGKPLRTVNPDGTLVREMYDL